MTDFLLALDQGTTSSRAIVFDREGRPVATARRPLDCYYPQPGWVEQDPAQIVSGQLDAAREALRTAGLGPEDLAAIGIANQRETTLVWERASGRPVGPAIVWQCRRTAGLCEQLRSQLGDAAVRERTGLVIDPYFSATKLRWLLDEVPDAQARAERGELLLGTVDTWLLWNLTAGAVHATDVSNASRTMLLNLHTLQWDETLLDALRLPPAMLPEVRPSSGDFGATAPPVLGAAVPLRAAIGDQQAALFGQACFQPGMAKSTYGTGCFLLMNTGARPVPSARGLLSTVAWSLGGAVEYALEGSVFVAGAAVQWLRDQLGLFATAAETETLARSVPDSGGVYFVPAFVGLGAPHWDDSARGLLIGLTRGTGKAHLARAALEAVAYQTADVLGAMVADSGAPLTELRVDGGAAANDFLLQFQADILGVPVVRPRVLETTALGAAYLAGLAAGWWGDPRDLSGQWAVERRFEPAMAEAQRAALLAGWRRAVERARDWATPWRGRLW